MKKMLKAGLIVMAGVAFVFAVLQVGTDNVHARPGYKKAFDAKYGDNAKAKEAKCGVCHYGESKKNRNDYGKAVGGALGAKDVKEADVINAALTKAEGEKSSVEGKTFGDLIKSGELPGKAP